MKKPGNYIALGLSLLFLYCSLCLFFSGEVITFQVKSQAEEIETTTIHSPSQAGLPAPENITIQNGDTRLAGWFFSNPRKAGCAVILHHGHRGRREGVLKYGPIFWVKGCDLLMYDARRHGESTGEFATWGFNEKYDLQKAALWLTRKSRLPLKSIGILGESMGAAISLQAAAIMPDIAFIIADSPFASFDRLLRVNGAAKYGKPILLLYPLTVKIVRWRAGFQPDDVSPGAAASLIQPPILLIHSRQDETLDYHYSEEVFAAVRHNRKEVHITDWNAAHCRSVNVNFKGYSNIVNAFLRRYAPAFGRRTM